MGGVIKGWGKRVGFKLRGVGVKGVWCLRGGRRGLRGLGFKGEGLSGWGN